VGKARLLVSTLAAVAAIVQVFLVDYDFPAAITLRDPPGVFREQMGKSKVEGVLRLIAK
tara:strand:- start:501 stop:677 length:177 start_codon:yes stop_codon:yes gene_type:complete